MSKPLHDMPSYRKRYGPVRQVVSDVPHKGRGHPASASICLASPHMP